MHLLLLSIARSFVPHDSSQTTNALWFLIPIAALDLVLIIFALRDLILRDPHLVRGNKIIWALVILFISTLGPIIYFIGGRKEA